MDIDLDINDRFIADCQAEAKRMRSYPDTIPEEQTPEDHARKEADEAVRDAEASKAKMFKTSGNYLESFANCQNTNNVMHLNKNDYVCISLVDDNYMVIGAYVEPSLQEKIIRGEYVDFARLLPKEHNFGKDQRMQLISHEGQTYFVPDEQETSGFVNFNKWEQAFRVFMNIFTKAHPERASELIQYNHVIFTASAAYQWNNVYTYDHEFRMHMSNFPNRNWSLILQQAWTMYLKDRLKFDPGKGASNSGFGAKRKKDECRHFNKGLCTAGSSITDHRCIECGKFRHGACICRCRLSKQGGTPKNNNRVANDSTSAMPAKTN